jgi:polynucleotide 5'-hydroxyl-kinase GRC3/NOL9
LGILSYDYQSPPDLLAASINGSILAIVEIEEPRAFEALAVGVDTTNEHDDMDTTLVTVSRTAEGLPYIPNPNDAALDPRYSRTLGLVLIRGIDVKHGCLQVITPTPLAEMERLRNEGRDMVLVHGKFDAPHWAYTEDLYVKSTQDDLSDRELEIADGETSEDEEEDETARGGPSEDNVTSAVPWIEILAGNQKRPVGSRVWRVRRDLGRHNTD